jgi:hypothetical protein
LVLPASTSQKLSGDEQVYIGYLPVSYKVYKINMLAYELLRAHITVKKDLGSSVRISRL